MKEKYHLHAKEKKFESYLYVYFTCNACHDNIPITIPPKSATFSQIALHPILTFLCSTYDDYMFSMIDFITHLLYFLHLSVMLAFKERWNWYPTRSLPHFLFLPKLSFIESGLVLPQTPPMDFTFPLHVCVTRTF